MKRILVLSALLCAALALPAAAATPEPAPDFTLKSAAGTNVRLAELRGEVVMVNFWATWCGPCRQEMPLLEKLYGKYKDLGFTLLGVNVEQDSAAARRYLQDVKVSFPVLFDPDNGVTRQFGVQGMPSTVLIDRSGNVRFVHKGYKPGYEMKYDEQVKQLVME